MIRVTQWNEDHPLHPPILPGRNAIFEDEPHHQPSTDDTEVTAINTLPVTPVLTLVA
jgi:hypothetical protein